MHSRCAISVSQTQLPQITEAATVLIRYILQHLDTQAPNKPSILLMALKVLCEGRKESEHSSGPASASSIISASGMKYLKYPEVHGKSPSVGSGGGPSSVVVSSGGSGSEKESPKSEMKRSRSDLSTVILQQLTTPLGAGVFTFAALSEEQIDCTVSINFS